MDRVLPKLYTKTYDKAKIIQWVRYWEGQANRPEIDPHIYAQYLTEKTWPKSGGKVVFSPGQLDIIMDKNVLGFLPQSIYGKWILEDLNIRIKKAKTIKHL